MLWEKIPRHCKEAKMKRIALITTAACLVAGLASAATAAPTLPELNGSGGSQGIRGRGDVRALPAPLRDRLIELSQRPSTYPPLTVFAEAAKPSELFGYYLLNS